MGKRSTPEPTPHATWRDTVIRGANKVRKLIAKAEANTQQPDDGSK